MSVALPTPDVQQFTAFTQGDEHALESIFRQEYDALIARATEMLGPELAHCAPRIVENAMLATWEKRTQFARPEGFTAFLDTAIEEEVAMQRRRHAALHHRDNGADPHRAPVRHTPIPSADEALHALEAKLHAPPPDHEQLVAEAKMAKRRHAQEHVETVGRKPQWVIPTILGIVVIAAIIGVQRWVGARGGDIAVTKALAATDARTVNSARGQRGTFTLGDESRVRIGSESSVRVPANFGQIIRTVELTGTARFEVASGNSRAFAVRAGNTEITATGTVFTVWSYPGAANGTSVAVDEGSVSVRVREGTGAGSTERTVNAGEAVQVTPDGRVVALASDVRDATFAWTRDSLIVADMPLRDVVPLLVRWYDMKLGLADPSLGDRRVSVRLGLQSSGAALDALSAAAGVTHGFGKDNEVLLKSR